MLEDLVEEEEEEAIEMAVSLEVEQQMLIMLLGDRSIRERCHRVVMKNAA